MHCKPTRTMMLQVLLACSLAGRATAASPYRETVGLAVTWDVGYGSNVCVLGNHPDVGAWSVTNNAVKLRWTAGNVWTGQVAVQAGTVLEFKFVARDAAAARYCDPANVYWESGGNRTATVPAQPAAPYPGKTVFYYSTWTNISIVFRGTNGFEGRTMTRAGPGRTTGESLYRVDDAGMPGEAMEFVFNGYDSGGTQRWDNSPYADFNNNYYTDLDFLILQDKSIYNYWPAATVSAPVLRTNWVNSTVPGIPGRPIRIYLPRGYTENTNRQYPVLYLQDGQNVFTHSVVPGESPAEAWDADGVATREISQGRMRECIIVGVDKSITNRGPEYTPPTDEVVGEGMGIANQFVQFVADNVRPTLDYNYRTRNDPDNTLVGGSSRGGLFSLYATYATNLFGGTLAMSPSLTRAPNYTTALSAMTRRAARIYMDTGTSEEVAGGDYWAKPWEGYDIFLGQGYVVNQNLLMRIGCGAGHNESAWRARLPAAFRFLLPARGEPNLVALGEFKTTLTDCAADGHGDLSAQFTALEHTDYTTQSATTLMPAAWIDLGSTQRVATPWAPLETVVTNAAAQALYLRVRARPGYEPLGVSP